MTRRTGHVVTSFILFRLHLTMRTRLHFVFLVLDILVEAMIWIALIFCVDFWTLSRSVVHLRTLEAVLMLTNRTNDMRVFCHCLRITNDCNRAFLHRAPTSIWILSKFMKCGEIDIFAIERQRHHPLYQIRSDFNFALRLRAVEIFDISSGDELLKVPL